MHSSNKQDVIVVGAGVIGIACAHYLEQSGFKVTVIDRYTIGSQCSYGNCGYISPSHVLPLTMPGTIAKALKSLFDSSSPFRIKPQLSLSLMHWFWQFSKRCNQQQMFEAAQVLDLLLKSSMQAYRQVIDALELECEWKNKGLLYVAESESGIDDLRKKSELLAQHYDVRSKFIHGEALTGFDPALRDGLAGAFHYVDDASLRPDKLNTQWSKALEKKGVDFIGNCELLSVKKHQSEIVSLQTTLGEYQADHYVIAAGAWSTKLAKELECHIPIQPGKGYSITTNRPDVCPIYPMLFPEHGVGISPFDSGYRIGSIMEFAGFNQDIPKHRIEQLKDTAKRYLIDQPDAPQVSTWYGWRPMTWDSLPVIGRVPSLNNAYLSTGHNMLGMSLAAVTGKLIAEVVKGEQPHLDVQALSPNRFNKR